MIAKAEEQLPYHFQVNLLGRFPSLFQEVKVGVQHFVFVGLSAVIRDGYDGNSDLFSTVL
jgi:hypothetical protein